MPAAAMSSDVFHAISGPHRRAILELVCQKERAVSEVVEALDLGQPSVSKHLKVLKDAHLVTVRRRGRQRIYSANPEALKIVHTWVQRFERFWNHQLDGIQKRAESAASGNRPETNRPETNRPEAKERRHDQ
jgi:DNA-binding transcriptional ArsR family regulator